MREARTLVWAYEAKTRDVHDTKALKLANPASWISQAYLRRQAEDPELTDAQVLQLHGCVWAASETTWLEPEKWAARANPERRLEQGERLVLGFDGSYRRDATALVACTLDGFVSPLEVWERPERAPSDWRVPRDEVEDAIADAMERFDVVELACDPPGWHSEIEGWRETYGNVVLDFPTNERPDARRKCCSCSPRRPHRREGHALWPDHHQGREQLAAQDRRGRRRGRCLRAGRVAGGE
jgi:hypothetical protein